MAHQLETFVVLQVGDVFFRSGKEIINAQHIVAVIQKAFAQVRAKEPGTAGNQNGASTLNKCSPNLPPPSLGEKTASSMN